jgi:hypothetical protein
MAGGSQIRTEQPNQNRTTQIVQPEWVSPDRTVMDPGTEGSGLEPVEDSYEETVMPRNPRNSRDKPAVRV